MSKQEPVWAVAVADGLTIPSESARGDRFARTPNRVLTRGDEVELTPDFIAATRDRFGNSVFEEGVPDEDTQTRLWGKVHLRPGRLGDHGELVALLEDERQRQAEAERTRAIREQARYGRRYVAAHDADVVAHREGAR